MARAQLQSFCCISSKLYWLRELDRCCAKLSEQMHLRISICSCRFVIPSCFSRGQITFLYACSEKNLQDAHISYIGHGHMVRTHLQQIKARTSELIEFGDSCFIFVVVVRFADNDHDRQTSRSVLLQTFFSACRKVIFDLKKNRRGYKNHLR